MEQQNKHTLATRITLFLCVLLAVLALSGCAWLAEHAAVAGSGAVAGLLGVVQQPELQQLFGASGPAIVDALEAIQSKLDAEWWRSPAWAPVTAYLGWQAAKLRRRTVAEVKEQGRELY